MITLLSNVLIFSIIKMNEYRSMVLMDNLYFIH